MNFGKAFNNLMVQENGADWYQNGIEDVAGDRGGLTKWGVTAATWASWLSENGDDNTRPVSEMTLNEAKAITKRWYWDAAGCGQLPDGLDYAMLQFAYVSGPVTAVRKLQAVLGVTEDGQVGPQTISAARAGDRNQLIQGLLAAQAAYVTQIVSRDPSQAKFLDGWNARISQAAEFIAANQGALGVVFFCFSLAAWL